ncbi:PilN domain-containing protein [Bradyrhizobium sp. HKCCYLS2038]|uniref:PilN domain-containing protein n=1 Tax=unclassified Bradyrhizobium TaxID=2631580 RepID=UPI003EBFB280
MISEIKDLFVAWMEAVAAAIDAALARIKPPRRVRLVEGEADHFSAQQAPGKRAGLPPTDFRLWDGGFEPALRREWQAALRGSHIELIMRSDQVLCRSVEFPKAAADFLQGMVRAQIDRLTPWTAADAVFGLSAPAPVAGDRIALIVAATSQHRVQRLVGLAAHAGAASIAGLVEADDTVRTTAPIKVFQRKLGPTGAAIDVPRLLRRLLIGVALSAAASLVVAAYVGGALEDEQQELARSITRHRTALRANQMGSSSEALLARRKQTSPSGVMVLEAISRALPDTTYVTELRIDGDKVQVVGLTQDAPSLIRLIEQSPQFTRATFFAPTTRGQNEPGERFHIEAHITADFGSRS